MKEDEGESFKWYLKSAKQGDPLSQFMVGLAYKNGSGVIKDINEAVKWYKAAADQDDPEAMQNLAMIYAFGDDGYKKDMDKAVVLIKAASQYSLGVLYLQGEGVKPDMAEARKWFGRAVAQGHEKAKQELAKL